MGYPMSYDRVVNRNHLNGDYEEGDFGDRLIAGDLRRLELDSRDEAHLLGYARAAGTTIKQAKRLLDLFFEGDVRLPDHCDCCGVNMLVGTIEKHHAECLNFPL